MRKYKEVQKTEQVIDEVICDVCGESCMKQFEIGANATKQFVGIQIKQPWGYLSNGKDLQIWEADICEKCVDEKLSFINFDKSPYIKGRLF